MILRKTLIAQFADSGDFEDSEDINSSSVVSLPNMGEVPNKYSIMVCNANSLKPLDPPPPRYKKKYLIIFGLTGLVVSFFFFSFLVYYPDGRPSLAPWRKQKLQRELDDLDNAEQYALLAKTSSTFPCYSCPSSQTIYLHAGQIWKYGVTTKGEKGRYYNTLEGRNLIYQIQFTGPLQECLKQEKLKIYHYPLLPENQTRDTILIRPPGNKQDS